MAVEHAAQPSAVHDDSGFFAPAHGPSWSSHKGGLAATLSSAASVAPLQSLSSPSQRVSFV